MSALKTPRGAEEFLIPRTIVAHAALWLVRNLGRADFGAIPVLDEISCHPLKDAGAGTVRNSSSTPGARSAKINERVVAEVMQTFRENAAA